MAAPAASRTLICSVLSASNFASNSLCHGYKTKTWRLNAELATKKLVKGTVRENIMVDGVLGGS